jgi:hypothetical protein
LRLLFITLSLISALFAVLAVVMIYFRVIDGQINILLPGLGLVIWGDFVIVLLLAIAAVNFWLARVLRLKLRRSQRLN